MIQKLLSTAASRVLIAILNLAVIWIAARFLGASAMGTITLIILGISIIQLFTAILGGSSLVYQASRHQLAPLLVMAWGWVIIGGTAVWAILYLFSLIPLGYTVDVLIISILGGIFTVNQNILLGKERVNLFNTMSILQVFILLVSFVLIVFVADMWDVRAYVIALYISMGTLAAISTLMILPPLGSFKMPGLILVKEAASFGGYLQAASLMQLFNYRLSYYIIEKFFDRATLGVFSLGVQIAESVWIIAKSMAVLQYSRISNSRDKTYPVQLTVNFLKLTGVITIVLISIVILLPKEFFVWLFQSEFSKITMVIASLSPGILAMALSLILSHYFSGTGQPRHNTISSGVGLVLTVILGFTLIPAFGLPGAGLTASLSYLASMLYQLIVFKRMNSLSWRAFIPTRVDFTGITREIKTIYSRS